MKIAVIGLGYIGLPTAVMFAAHKKEVTGFDTNEEVISKLRSGSIHIEEPFLQEKFSEVLEKGLFQPSPQLNKADVFIIAVPTPHTKNYTCDTSYIEKAVCDILPHLEKGNTLILESTVAPKTTTDYIQPMLEKNGFVVGKDVFLIHCPERVLPGKIMHELIYNNRIIGGVTPACTEKGKEIYSTFVKGALLTTDASTAELSKLMENTFRDVNIALANELVKVGNALHIDALEVIRLANLHPRVNLHQPGPGVGGHCLAVDPYFIAAEAPFETPLIQQSRAINSSMPDYIVEKVLCILERIGGKKITLFGLTYKGNVDDVRESPALEIYQRLKTQQDICVTAYDPHVTLPFVEQDIEKALEKADIALVLTDHDEFIHLDTQLHFSGQKTILIDTKNIVEKADYSLATFYQATDRNNEVITSGSKL